VLFDSNGSVARQYRVVGIPTFVLLDRKGKIVYFDNILPPDIEKRL
ncbi:MAG: TlpA family protein disulfide reductase, partial [Planctomycetes bacterium]|nr:TlpA family protein disulfide reductase [Planctomycetota bacterium]